MGNNHGTWFATVHWYEDDFGKCTDITVHNTRKQAKKEQEMFGGGLLEVWTSPMACSSLEDWQRNIEREIQRRVQDNPKFLKKRSVVDLRLE